MESYHESSVDELLDAAMKHEVDRMKAANSREGKVIAWERLRLLKEIQGQLVTRKAA